MSFDVGLTSLCGCSCVKLDTFEATYVVCQTHGDNEAKACLSENASSSLDMGIPGNKLYEVYGEIRLAPYHPAFRLGQLLRKCYDSVFSTKKEVQKELSSEGYWNKYVQMEIMCKPSPLSVISKRTCDAFFGPSRGRYMSHISAYTDPTLREEGRETWQMDDDWRITYGNLIMRTSTDEKITLFAYDTYSDDLAWHLTFKGYRLVYCDINVLGLTVLVLDSNKLLVFNPESGEQKYSISLPATPHHDLLPFIEITPSGFCYFRAENVEDGKAVIFGGRISKGVWEQSFMIRKWIGGHLSSLQEFAVFQLKHLSVEGWYYETTVLSQDGSIQTFPDTMALLIKDGKIYTVDSKGFFTMQECEGTTILQLKGSQYSVPFDIGDVGKLVDVQEDGRGNLEIKSCWRYSDEITTTLVPLSHMEVKIRGGG